MSWNADAPRALTDSTARGTALRDPADDGYGGVLRESLFSDDHPGPELFPPVGELLAAALGDAPGAVALVRGSDHRVEFVNRVFREGFGLPAGVGGPLVGLVPQFRDTGLLDALDHVYATGTVFNAPEVRIGAFGPSGRPVVLRFSCSPLRRSSDGPVDGVLLSAVDCTDQATAMDRLRAGEYRHRYAAVALQRSLLPQRLSQPDDLRIAGCYLPASADDHIDGGREARARRRAAEAALHPSAGIFGGGALFQVGGDWYDVIPLGSGRTGLVMGDVMGRGVHAAAVMGQLRAAVRAYAALNLSPGELLLHLDRHASELEGVAYAEASATAGASDLGALATVVYAVYDPDAQTLTYARAGHLAPLLRLPDGTVVDLDEAGGPPLGAGEWTWAEAEAAMPPGCYLALFTDGLVERRGTDLDRQIGRLREVFAAAPLSAAPEESGPAAARGPVDLVRDRLLAGMDLPPDHDDDVALLAVHVPRWQGLRAELFRVAEVELTGGAEIASRARAFALGVLRSWHVGEDLCDAGVLAVSELIANAAVHGRPPVLLRLRRTDRRLIINVRDGDDHLPRRRLAESTDEDGRGIGIVAALADSWGTRQLDTGKSVWCEFSLTPRHEGASATA